MNKRQCSALILVSTLLSTPAMATDQFFLGYSYWHYKVSGTYQDSGSSFDLGNGGYAPSSNSRAMYRMRWDTGPGWWMPDLAASFGRIEVSGQQNVTTSANVGPVPVTVNSTATVYTNVRDLDVTARWPLQLGWGRLSLGVTAKQLRGSVLINDTASTPTQTRESVNALFPMAHAFLEVPFGSRLRVGGGGDWAALDGDEADNILAIARLKVIGPLDLTAGWQSKHYKVHDGYRLDTRLQGWQVGGELAF